MPKLDVTVVCTRGIKGGDFMSEADPFVKLKYGKQAFKTRVQQDAGEDAEFNETFTFDVTGPPYDLDVQVMDKDFLFDQFLAKTTVSFDLSAERGRHLDVYALKDKKGKNNGQITLALKYTT